MFVQIEAVRKQPQVLFAFGSCESERKDPLLKS